MRCVGNPVFLRGHTMPAQLVSEVPSLTDVWQLTTQIYLAGSLREYVYFWEGLVVSVFCSLSGDYII